MSDRSPMARDRSSLARLSRVRIHYRLQVLTYAAAGLLIALALISPHFARVAVHAGQAFIALILN